MKIINCPYCNGILKTGKLGYRYIYIEHPKLFSMMEQKKRSINLVF